jgi:hypothetical protein
MRIEGVVWLNAIVDKLAVRHHVAMHEVEEVLTNDPKFRFVERGDRQDEDVYMALGQTFEWSAITETGAPVCALLWGS